MMCQTGEAPGHFPWERQVYQNAMAWTGGHLWCCGGQVPVSVCFALLWGVRPQTPGSTGLQLAGFGGTEAETNLIGKKPEMYHK